MIWDSGYVRSRQNSILTRQKSVYACFFNGLAPERSYKIDWYQHESRRAVTSACRPYLGYTALESADYYPSATTSLVRECNELKRKLDDYWPMARAFLAGQPVTKKPRKE